MIRLQSEIGGKRVPLQHRPRGSGILVWSQCTRVSTAAPIFIICETLKDFRSSERMIERLTKSGYQKCTVERPWRNRRKVNALTTKR